MTRTSPRARGSATEAEAVGPGCGVRPLVKLFSVIRRNHSHGCVTCFDFTGTGFPRSIDAHSSRQARVVLSLKSPGAKETPPPGFLSGRRGALWGLSNFCLLDFLPVCLPYTSRTEHALSNRSLGAQA